MKRLILLIIGVVLYGVLSAQKLITTDTISVKIYFRQGYSILDSVYRNNQARLDTFSSRISELRHNQHCELKSGRIVSSASPEGYRDLNNRLAKRRGENFLLSFLYRTTDLPDSLVRVDALGVDWDGLAAMVDTSSMSYRDEVLRILRHTPELIFKDGVLVDGRKRQLGMLRGGRPWRYMYKHFFPELRYSEAQVVYQIKQQPVSHISENDTLTDTLNDMVTGVQCDTVADVQRDTSAVILWRPPFYMALKSNLLYDAMLVPNIGIEFYAGRGWSVGAGWMYGWWHSDTHHRYWRIYGGEIDVRKYFGRRAEEKPLTGHHLGIYGNMFTYDFELGGTGYLSELSYGVGIEYGYSLPIGRRFNLDFGIGLGYIGGEYKVYEPIDAHYVWQRTQKRHWIGPTKAEISLVWLIGRGNYNQKGGKR